MNNIKKLSTLWIVLLIGCLSKVSAVTARTFKRSNMGDTAKYSRSQIDGSISILGLISLINNYLWFAIWFFCFLFMIWNWYKLISANGDEKVMSSARKALLWSGIWIAVCLLSYIIVKIAVNLFA